MRGKRGIHRGLHVALRIIPAHAGQTSCQAKRSRDCSDHPRACGANGIPSAPWSATHGSSPRMRGEPITLFSCSGYERIIPAHAGQTWASTSFVEVLPDHPRTCGANREYDGQVAGVEGSSPRMRGKRRKLLTDLSNIRIIPAHAGQTPPQDRTRQAPADHPRTCGANMLPLSPSWTSFGSSPHMRGKHVGVRGHRDGRRIISAHAGQTGLH